MLQRAVWPSALAVHPHIRGENCSSDSFGSAIKVHPHIRGENLSVLKTAFFGLGSPPHTWGKLRLPGGLAIAYRFTPTYVGKIFQGPISAGRRTVHPHIRGENELQRKIAREKYGSPPHTWGK